MLKFQLLMVDLLIYKISITLKWQNYLNIIAYPSQKKYRKLYFIFFKLFLRFSLINIDKQSIISL
jgi:hypothetical protein